MNDVNPQLDYSNRMLSDIEKDFKPAVLGSNFMSYDSTKFYSLNDTHTDYENVNESFVNKMQNDGKGREFNRNSMIHPVNKDHYENVNRRQQIQNSDVKTPPGFVNYKQQITSDKLNKDIKSFSQSSSSLQINSQNTNYYQCPLCSLMAVSTCGCQFKDASCQNGHRWYRTSNGIKQIGTSPNHQ